MKRGPLLAPRGPFWAAVRARYKKGVDDPQPDLLRQGETPEELFSRFVPCRLWPVPLMENGCLRNVLRSSASLQPQDPWSAGRAFAHAMQEWRFHIAMRRPAPGLIE